MPIRCEKLLIVIPRTYGSNGRLFACSPNLIISRLFEHIIPKD